MLSLALLQMPASAHSPTDIICQYDQTAKALDVKIMHNTARVHDHYVRTLQIYQNDKLFKEFTYQWQKNKLYVEETVDISIGSTDVIKVVAIDNHGGTKELFLDQSK